jgi:hypothetical protein
VSQPTSIPLTRQQRRVIAEGLELLACNPSMNTLTSLEITELAGFVLGNLSMDGEDL